MCQSSVLLQWSLSLSVCELCVVPVAAGTIDGDVRVSGHPKVQKDFARVMGYVEQSDIHSPNVRSPWPSAWCLS